jgi:hypothetical protein
MNSFANIRGILGVVMKKIFLLYLVARGFGGVKWLELLVGANSRRFFVTPRKNNPLACNDSGGACINETPRREYAIDLYIFFRLYHFIRVFSKSVDFIGFTRRPLRDPLFQI